ncbi:hypothetical protein [Actinomadura verrucosospora]
MPNQPTPEDDESTSVASTRKRLLKKRVIIGAAFVVTATGVLAIKLAMRQGDTEDLETDESSIDRAPTSSEHELDAIVRAVAAGIGKIKSVSTNGFNVEAQVRTNSGKGAWPAHFTFDGKTGYYTYSHPYPDAVSPRAFGDEVGRRIREAAANSTDLSSTCGDAVSGR